MAGSQKNIETIEYPNKTSEWGKSLIDTLNGIFSTFLADVTKQFDEIKLDIATKVEAVEKSATDALALAQENQKNFEIFKEETNKKIDYVVAENKSLKYLNDRLEVKVKQNVQQSNSSENYSRRNNIVVRGIVETDNETNEKCEEEIKSFLLNKLSLSAESVSALRIERCHRMGGKRRGAAQQHKRPIIMRFGGYKDKSIVWDRRSQLTGREYSMSENFSRGTEYNRQKLYPIFKKAKHMDRYKKVHLNEDILVLDDQRYNVDSIGTLPADVHPRRFSEKRNHTHLLVGGIHSEFQPLSNWYPCKVQFKGHTFNSSEQAYQWAKADFCQDDAAASKLLFTTSPRDAKDLGSEIKGLRDTDWDQKKNGIMEEILRNKFRDNKDLKKQLLDTKDIILAEASRDRHWAVGLPINSADLFITKKWTGHNCLGRILASVRTEMSA